MHREWTPLLRGGLKGLCIGALAFLLEMSARFLYLYYYTGDQMPVGYLTFFLFYALAGSAFGVGAAVLWQTTRRILKCSIAVRLAAIGLFTACVAAVVAAATIKLELTTRAVLGHLGTLAFLCAGFAAIGWILSRLRERYGTWRLSTALGGLCLVLIGSHFVLYSTHTVDRFLTEVPGSARSTEKPNILLLTIDTLRVDRLGTYGYTSDISENIDRLAREGVLFERAVAHSPWTRTSFGSILTSTYPSQHGAFMLLDSDIGSPDALPEDPTSYNSGLRDDALTMAQVLLRNGYRNICLQTNPNASFEYGFDRGFHLFLFRELFAIPISQRSLLGRYLHRGIRLLGWPEGRPFRYAPPNADEVYRAFDTLFSSGFPQPFFIWVNFLDPHAPYLSREHKVSIEEAGISKIHILHDTPIDELSEAYDQEIRFADHYLGKVLDLLDGQGVLDDTVVIFTSDHGEEFEDHQVEIQALKTRGRFHGHSLYSELLDVPLIIRYPPRLPRGARVEKLVRHIDLLPTVLDLAEVDPGPWSVRQEGSSLLPLMTGQDDEQSRWVFSERNLYGRQQRSVQDDRYKLIVEVGTERIELYDVIADPGERENLAESRRDEADRLLTLLTEWASRMGPVVPPPESDAASSEDLESLRALGYVQ